MERHQIEEVWPDVPEDDIDEFRLLLTRFENAWNDFANFVYNIHEKKGHNSPNRTDWEFLALIHSEVTEVVEALREGNPAHHTLPVSKMEVDLGDILIRTAHFGVHRKHNIAQAAALKALFNASGRKPNG